MQFKQNIGGKTSGYKRYQKANITTASPAKLILMLYDGALRFLTKAIEGVKEDDLALVHELIIKTENIVIELINCLDFDQGGEIAKNLNAIYRFVYRKLIEANVNKDIPTIEICISLISPLRDGWNEMMLKIHEKKDTKENNILDKTQKHERTTSISLKG